VRWEIRAAPVICRSQSVMAGSRCAQAGAENGHHRKTVGRQTCGSSDTGLVPCRKSLLWKGLRWVRRLGGRFAAAECFAHVEQSLHVQHRCVLRDTTVLLPDLSRDVLPGGLGRTANWRAEKHRLSRRFCLPIGQRLPDLWRKQNGRGNLCRCQSECGRTNPTGVRIVVPWLRWLRRAGWGG